MTNRFSCYVLAACCFLGSLSHCQAGTVTFGSGANTFQMEFVTIGNPGNAADTTGAPNPAGSVGYTYGIGKFEVSEDMIDKFNAIQSLQITKNTRGSNMPATSISWNEAARFVNWLNESTGGTAAYKFTTDGVRDNITLWTSSDSLDYDAANPYRSKRALFVLPSYNEWYKAAYYSPVEDLYYDYATGSNERPVAVVSGTDAGTAVYQQTIGRGPAPVDKAGGLSPFSVMGLGGNVREWEESSFDLLNNSGSSGRVARGGAWWWGRQAMQSTFRDGPISPTFEGEAGVYDIGFRVVSLSTPGGGVPGGEVPEPASMAIFGLGALGLAYRALRRNTA